MTNKLDRREFHRIAESLFLPAMFVLMVIFAGLIEFFNWLILEVLQ